MGKLINAAILTLVINMFFMIFPAESFNSSTDESSLLSFKSHITSDPNNILASNWSQGTSFCTWIGVTCSQRHPRVVGLNLTGMGLEGTISREIGNLSFLIYLDISNNTFTGLIPDTIWALGRLRLLNMALNNLTGNLPGEIGNLAQLQILRLGRNSFTGAIPISIGNLSNLRTLSFGDNNFQGTIPSEMGRLSLLTWLDLQGNQLNGEVPLSIFNLSRLETISLVRNQFSGSLPSSIGQGLPNLQGLYLTYNNFNGSIPTSISNLSRLDTISLTYNQFSGLIPVNLGNLQNLQTLNLGGNQFSNDLSVPEQDFLSPLSNCRQLNEIQIGRNPITGELPRSLFSNLSTTLERFVAFSCQFSGTIPEEIGNLSSLIWLTLADNNLTGTIPQGLGRLRSLQRLTLYINKMEGSIPHSLCNLQNLFILTLFGNRLSGPIPSCLGNLPSLRQIYLNENTLNSTIPSSFWQNGYIQAIDFSNNFIIGSLPEEVGNARGLVGLYLSGNQLSGSIPNTIGRLDNLINVTLSDNRLTGPIPESLGRLRDLQLLDLSRNNLSGSIPPSLESLAHLVDFNVSFNELSGEIPNGGPFVNFTSDRFRGNRGLCGASRFSVQSCRRNSTQKHSKGLRVLVRYTLPSVGAIAIALAIIVVWVLRNRRRKSLISSSSPDSPGLMHERVSYYEIIRSTNNLDEGNLIGKGGIGSVYKGEFSKGVIFAVKVFNLDLQGALKTFETECNTMRSIRHRNLVKVITSCSNLEFKALVLEYMPNGNLDKWLYSPNCFLNIDQRLGIMIDVASAIEYLHQGHSPSIVHCDIKPNNILLNEDMVAHVADFGIAKLLSQDERMIQTKTLGTIGYMAPEYGSTGTISTKVDVYSYGILLMETFTRKRPTNDMFYGELTIKKWVFESFPDSLTQIIDGQLLNMDDKIVMGKHMRCLTSIMILALECTTDFPGERPEMNDVLVRLEKIRFELQNTIFQQEQYNEK